MNILARNLCAAFVAGCFAIGASQAHAQVTVGVTIGNGGYYYGGGGCYTGYVNGYYGGGYYGGYYGGGYYCAPTYVYYTPTYVCPTPYYRNYYYGYGTTLRGGSYRYTSGNRSYSTSRSRLVAPVSRTRTRR